MTESLTLLRHAHTVWNGPPKRFQGRANSELSERGIEQCRSQKQNFQWVQRIVASPAKRVQQTLQYIFEDRASLPDMTLDANLWEINNGWYSGLLLEEVKARDSENLKAWFDTPGEIRPGGGETLLDMLCRASSALNNARDLPLEGTLVATHGGIIRVLTLALQNRSLNDFHDLNVGNLDTLTLTKQDLDYLQFWT